MQIGSLVQCVADFSELEKIYGIEYPKDKEMLVVSGIENHPDINCRKKGIQILHFEEYPDHPGCCDKTLDDIDNFVELQGPGEMHLSELFSAELDENAVLVEELNDAMFHA